ncbi:MAG: hypothetical protein ACKVS6_06495 [Planctomycetota bacterium]
MNTSKTISRTKPAILKTGKRTVARKSGGPQSARETIYGQRDLFSQFLSEPVVVPPYFPSEDSFAGSLVTNADPVSVVRTSAAGASKLRFGRHEISVGVFIIFLIATVIFV